MREVQLAIDFTPKPAPYQRRSATSKAAAKAVEPRILTQLQRILSYIKQSGDSGVTDDDIQAFFALDGSTVRPRRGELAQRGLIKKTDRTRVTRKGREAVVWVAV